MDNIDQKKLEEEEEKLNLLKDDLEYANEEKGLQEEIFYFLQEQFQEELEEQQKYLDLEKEYEDIIDALQNELNDENQVHQEKQQDLDNTNLLIEQNMREEQQEIAISQLCKRDKELASQERQKLQSEIIIIMQNIAELKEKEKKIEQQKKEKEEKQITMNKLIGLVTFAVRFVCPIQAALVGLAGVFFSNVDYFGASEKLKLDEKKQKQEELSKRQSDLEQISEEKYQKSLKSAQSKSQSILKGLTTKKDVENKLQNLRNNMLDQSNKIQQMVQKKTQCSNFAQKIEQKYQDTLPRLQELRANLQNNSYADIIQKITLQQQIKQNKKVQKENIKKEKKSQQKRNTSNFIIIRKMGPYMSQPKKEKEYDFKKGKKIEFCAASMQGWRNTMEDSHIADISIEGDEDACVFGVFDGHGGSEVAQFVKKYFVQELTKNPNFKSKTNLGDALKETFISIDKRMITKEGIRELHQIRDPSKGGNQDYDLTTIYAGCTANVCLIYNNQLYVANSGDSRSVLCSKDQPFAMSIDHKPDDKIELERIRAAGGFVAEGRVNGNLNLSRAMGDFEYKDISEQSGDKVYPKDPEKTMITVVPDIKSKNLIATDRFLLMGCDGIWECKSNEELMEFIIQRLDKNLPLKNILEELLDAILAKDCSEGIGCDNMTVILVVFNNTK